MATLSAREQTTHVLAPVARRTLTTLPMLGVVYMMCSGGPFGLEELVATAGFDRALFFILITPILWSLPTALMVAELSCAMPEDGGYYIWVNRAMGPFWGFMEAWLSLAASIFDMAIYPTIFMLYFSQLFPQFANGHKLTVIGIVMVLICAGWNVLGARAVGKGSDWLMLPLLGPFVILVIHVLVQPAGYAAQVSAPTTQQLAVPATGFFAGIAIAMWNYMGWDNISTVAGEVDRPNHTYPIAIAAGLSLVVLTYAIPVWAVGRTGIDASQWQTGAWVGAANALVAPWLGTLIAVGGMVCGIGMFNALILSYSRVPMAMAETGMLPAIFAKLHSKTGAPWVSIAALGIAYSMALELGFEKLVEIDVILYGAALLLEFVALVILRVKEPELPRPFKIPGGTWMCASLAIGPAVLIGLAVQQSAQAKLFGLSAVGIGLAVAAFGPPLYWLRRKQIELTRTGA